VALYEALALEKVNLHKRIALKHHKNYRQQRGQQSDFWDL